MASPFRVVLMTAPRGKRAEILARGLVTERLAACVNVVPGAVSHYRWRGRMRRDAESLLVAKTSAAKLPALKRWVAARHPYAIPEVLALKVEDGAKPYLQWLAGELE
ncbi:MAG: divalent-cation tolerance protein CutA [Elusimicrobia bacterium]|nr:divalent-cation tolerance protein CutA [Elusimicrobiota bacterium]